MPPSEEAIANRNALEKELRDESEFYLSRARQGYWAAHILMALTLASSAAATVCGIFLGASGPITGTIASIPAGAALLAITFKPAGRSNWHYRKVDSLDALRRKLMFELPLADETVATVAKEWSKLNAQMSSEFEKEFTLSWARFSR